MSFNHGVAEWAPCDPQPRLHHVSISLPHLGLSPLAQYSSGATEDLSGLRIYRIFQEYTRRWDRGVDTKTSISSPLGNCNIATDLQYGNNTVAELVFCLVINIKENDGTIIQLQRQDSKEK